jgi:CubicO group peptidase (beta-lactamase class C family)
MRVTSYCRPSEIPESGLKNWMRGVLVALLVAVSLAAPLASHASNSVGGSTSDGESLDRKYPSLRALVVARGNCVVSEYYRQDITPATRSPIYSVTKSLLSILVGIALDAGYLRLDESLGEIFPEAAGSSVDPRVRDVTVRDLLTMTAGFDVERHAVSAVQVGALWRWMLERPMSYAPGAHFEYDDVSVNLLSVVLSKAIREDATRFAQQSLFEPLDIKDVAWVSDAEGHLIGDSGLHLTAREMAKIGLLYLQKGHWRGKPVVSESYVLDSTLRHNDGGPPVNAAYGYLWWVGPATDPLRAFFAAGHNSQLILVVPDRNLVVAVAADGLPGGSRRFVEEAVLPNEAAIPVSAPCIERLQ